MSDDALIIAANKIDDLMAELATMEMQVFDSNSAVRTLERENAELRQLLAQMKALLLNLLDDLKVEMDYQIKESDFAMHKRKKAYAAGMAAAYSDAGNRVRRVYNRWLQLNTEAQP